jgi:hypothetical protein
VASSKDRAEVNRLLRNMGLSSDMVKTTREASKTAGKRTRRKDAQYKALRELASKRKNMRTTEALEGDVTRMQAAQVERSKPKTDDRTAAEKETGKTEAEFKANVVRSVRAGSRERPERERAAKEKERKAKEAKAAASKKANTAALKDKVFGMEERQRKSGAEAQAFSEVDHSIGRKRVKKSERLSRAELKMLEMDPKVRAKFEAMANRGLIGKTKSKARGPAQDEDLEAFLASQPSWRDEDATEEAKPKSKGKVKGGGGKIEPAATPDRTEEAVRNTRLAADQKGSRSDITPAGPRSKSGISRKQFMAMSKAKQNKALKSQMSDAQWNRWKEAGVSLGTEVGWEIAATILTGGAGLALSMISRTVGKLAVRGAAEGIKAFGKEGAKRSAKAAAKEAAKRKATREAAEARAKEAQREARNAKARERRRAKKEAKEKADQQQARDDAKWRAENRQRRENQKNAREKKGQTKSGPKQKKQSWQENDASKGWNTRQKAAARAKSRSWAQKAKKMTREQLRTVYDKFNISASRGPSAGQTIEELKRHIIEAIRAGAPI